VLDSILCAKSVTVIDASRFAGKVGDEILSNLVEGGDAGRLVSVNPRDAEVLGLKCYLSLTEYGAAGFTAGVLVEDRAMLTVLRHSGFRVGSRLEGRVHRVELDFQSVPE
jgi:acetate---CoA ligase (ADP-forming)